MSRTDTLSPVLRRQILGARVIIALLMAFIIYVAMSQHIDIPLRDKSRVLRMDGWSHFLLVLALLPLPVFIHWYTVVLAQVKEFPSKAANNEVARGMFLGLAFLGAALFLGEHVPR